ncbi:MAG: 16S rRNA (cytosine(1402)-N(4))-methyltransferase RsmH [Alphaproteobacteria bacterium]|nr:16S rRNA (cytosine(1402)-N(4))-methyltransferase RsmH [Alphaproteobacteria bacterium]MBR6598419.1 16S rRNA (cytosine(1402)-N(4))-methyltransferase RsmH [Alphaproteobacteria bacterium]
MKHIPVLLDAVLNALGDITGKTIVDCTFGAGGYSRAFLSLGANVIAFDRDPNVVADANAMRAEYGDCFTFVPAPFSNIADLEQTVDAIVFDLGISSMQIDTAERGFSFRMDAPLDMRMASSGLTAAQLIEQKSVSELAEILRDYGDVKKANILARVIKDAHPQTTFELRDLIHNPKDVAPVFQALRIAVNDEMGELERALAVVPELLVDGGKCICVTFHSLEDRIVKNTFRRWTTAPGDPRMPIVAAAPFELLRTALPDVAELENNPRARSAHMRGVIKSC